MSYKFNYYLLDSKLLFKVSETDMYLLGAIEKLVHKVDLMNKRLKRLEELIQHIMEGNASNREGQLKL